METAVKGLLQSKTFWLAALQAIAYVLVVFSTSYPEVGWLLTAKSAVDIALRYFTTTPLSGVMPRYRELATGSHPAWVGADIGSGGTTRSHPSALLDEHGRAPYPHLRRQIQRLGRRDVGDCEVREPGARPRAKSRVPKAGGPNAVKTPGLYLK